MSIQKIHHINFLVKELDAAIRIYTALLGGSHFTKDELSARGALTARTRLGEQWIVLVQPTDPDSVPGRHLKAHGEGFFLMSLGVDDMESSLSDLANAGLEPTRDTDRKGLLNWWVRDLDTDQTFGAQIQLCEERLENRG
ncbi:VOC family protein [Marinobacter gelidimuriae]|uniref:VOC family protein n=1 Tax=Marinobacter gelidimuriae TaxID=2739064 RepID=UPI00037DDEBC|nr:VOC family protein [Marinobacter gelidimuriae]